MSRANAKATRIIRKGNGGAFVLPSPLYIRPGESFVMQNWTECPAEVAFDGVPITPKMARIGPRPAEATFAVDENAPWDYYEYEVALHCHQGERLVKQYVEGGSKPSVIIDP